MRDDDLHARSAARRRAWLARGLTAALLLLAVGWAAAEAGRLYLRIRSAPVRSSPSFAEGEQKVTAYFGQSLEVLERSKDGDWVKVRFALPAPRTVIEDAAATVDGWVHATALSEAPPAAEAANDTPWVKDGAAGLAAEGNLRLAESHAKRKRVEWVPASSPGRLYPSAHEVEEFMEAGKLGLHRPDWPSLEGGTTK